eukprot:TRINITY_DN781_c0_g1_i1.p1 TRINITY_DN781_c0_g1~~TRINITY_DN781_c0_g1_i1.p1  ORF type:complete len:276 (+),score=64.78 TRINITY_DN781_c0_g1_i1:31-828(+)
MANDLGETEFAKKQQFLDTEQYSKKGILLYEKIFGRDFVSTGGREKTAELLKMLGDLRGKKVLDIGCGLGGSAFMMAELGADVTGVDLSANMLRIAKEKNDEYKYNVKFLLADAMSHTFPAETYDLIYSRDTILHIKDKKTLFERLYAACKVGGTIFITDYCCGDQQHTKEFDDYVAQRGYALLSPESYGKVLESAGFTMKRTEDYTDHFTRILLQELDRFQKLQDEIVRDFSQDDFDHIIAGWKIKLVRCNNGDQKWGLFLGTK